MKNIFLATTAVISLLYVLPSNSAMATGIEYFEDPIYETMAAEDHHPMHEMMKLASEGDVRAQFILGDLYSKGKGGLPKDFTKAKKWFEESAMHGYKNAFIRLAAIAKHENKPIEAWKWYTIAIRNFDSTDSLRDHAIKARAELSKKNKFDDSSLGKRTHLVRKWEDKREVQLTREKKEAYERDKREERKRAEIEKVSEQETSLQDKVLTEELIQEAELMISLGEGDVL